MVMGGGGGGGGGGMSCNHDDFVPITQHKCRLTCWHDVSQFLESMAIVTGKLWNVSMMSQGAESLGLIHVQQGV